MPTCYRKVNGKYYSPSEYKKLKSKSKKKHQVKARRRHGYAVNVKGRKYEFVDDNPSPAKKKRMEKIAQMTYEHERDTNY